MKLRSALALTVLVSSLAVAGPASPASPAPRCDSAYVQAYRVEVRTDQRVYRLGDRVRVFVTVTDRATGTPAADVETGVAFTQKKIYVYATERTNAQGRASLEIALGERMLEPGWVTLQALARTTIRAASCPEAGLYGYRRIRKAFFVRR